MRTSPRLRMSGDEPICHPVVSLDEMCIILRFRVREPR